MSVCSVCCSPCYTSIIHCFSSTTTKVVDDTAYFSASTILSTLPALLGWSDGNFADLLHNKTSPCAIVWCCLRDATFSRFDTIPACNTQTHRQTGTRWRLLPAHRLRRAGKNEQKCSIGCYVFLVVTTNNRCSCKICKHFQFPTNRKVRWCMLIKINNNIN